MGREVLVISMVLVFASTLFVLHYSFTVGLPSPQSLMSGLVVQIQDPGAGPRAPVVSPPFDIKLTENQRCWHHAGVAVEDVLIAGHLLEGIPCASVAASGHPFSVAVADGCVELKTFSGESQFCDGRVISALHEETKIQARDYPPIDEAPSRWNVQGFFIALFLLGVLLMVWREYEVGLGFGRPLSKPQRITFPLLPRERKLIEIRQDTIVPVARSPMNNKMVQEGVQHLQALCASIEHDLAHDARRARRSFVDAQRLFSSIRQLLDADHAHEMDAMLHRLHQRLRAAAQQSKIRHLLQRLQLRMANSGEQPVLPSKAQASRHDVSEVSVAAKEGYAHPAHQSEPFGKQLSDTQRAEAMRLLGDALRALPHDRAVAQERYRKFRELVTTSK